MTGGIHRPCGFASTPVNGPVPTAATFNTGTGILQVQFDQQLDPRTLDAANWFCWKSLNAFEGVSGSASGNTATIQMTNAGLAARPAVCSYRPPPYDVLGLDYSTAAGFEDFPMT
jgi:hypothetical protein